MAREPKMCAAPGCVNMLPPRRRRFCSDECRRAGRRHERYHETPDFAQMVVRMVRALARRTGTDTAEFGAVWELLGEAERAAVKAIDDLRARGFSWADIAAEAGVSKQAISQWRKRRPDGDDDEADAPEPLMRLAGISGGDSGAGRPA